MRDFVINDGVLVKYTGSGGDVSVPDGVRQIGYAVFGKCVSLRHLALPDGLEKIGDRAVWILWPRRFRIRSHGFRTPLLLPRKLRKRKRRNALLRRSSQTRRFWRKPIVQATVLAKENSRKLRESYLKKKLQEIEDELKKLED